MVGVLPVRIAVPDAAPPVPVADEHVQKAAIQARRMRVRASDDIHYSKALISEHWQYVAPIILSLVAIAALLEGALPPIITGILCGLAGIIPIAAPMMRRFEVKEGCNILHRIAAMLIVVASPMLMFGLGISLWAEQGSLSWEIALGVLIVCAAMTAVIQAGKAPGLFASQIMCWSGVAVAGKSYDSMLLLGVSIILASIISYMQSKHMRTDSGQAQERERIRTRAEDILSDYENTGQGWFWETDRRGMLTFVSETVAKTLGHERSEDILGKAFTDLFQLSAIDSQSERTLTFHLSARASFQELAMRAAVHGDERWWSVSGRPIYDDFNNFVGFRGSGTDLTEKKRMQENASRLAHFDSLTGLANRFQMSQLLEKILNSPQSDHRSCALLLLDLDRFKQVNDTMGHPAGDALLKQVAERLKWAVGDQGCVGRLGGDEFQILLPGRAEPECLATLSGHVISSLSQPYLIDGSQVVIGASIGISMAPDNGVTSEALIRNADLALYAAKDGGRGCYRFYANNLHAEAEERRLLEQDLRDAIRQGDLRLAYQPVVNTVTEKISGFEALLRWEHPTKGDMPTQQFVEIAEDTGLIGAIGEWALRTACHDMAKWPDNVRVAVNVSPLQFANPQLPAIVTNALAQAGVAADRLELEITESVFLNDDDGTDAMFAALKGIGVRLVLDDFGTGYSSLGYLKTAPFDKIKIDQSFVRGANEPGSRNGAIIASITSLADALGMETTAEGVETLDELDVVRTYGCSHVQGYIYDRALSVEAAGERLGSGLASVARGPRSARAPRQTMLRRMAIIQDGKRCNAIIRNISATGALVEGLWNVPVGTVFEIAISQSHVVAATTRWCVDGRMGVEFASALSSDRSGRIVAIDEQASAQMGKPTVRQTG